MKFQSVMQWAPYFQILKRYSCLKWRFTTFLEWRYLQTRNIFLSKYCATLKMAWSWYPGYNETTTCKVYISPISKNLPRRTGGRTVTWLPNGRLSETKRKVEAKWHWSDLALNLDWTNLLHILLKISHIKLREVSITPFWKGCLDHISAEIKFGFFIIHENNRVIITVRGESNINYYFILFIGNPSSKYEHRRISALLRNIRNIRICMRKKPIVSVTYGNERI